MAIFQRKRKIQGIFWLLCHESCQFCVKQCLDKDWTQKILLYNKNLDGSCHISVFCSIFSNYYIFINFSVFSSPARHPNFLQSWKFQLFQSASYLRYIKSLDMAFLKHSNFSKCSPLGPLCTVGPKAVFADIVSYRAKNMPLIWKVEFFGRLPLNHTRKNN